MPKIILSILLTLLVQTTCVSRWIAISFGRYSLFNLMLCVTTRLFSRWCSFTEWRFWSQYMRQKSCRFKITLENPFESLHPGVLHDLTEASSARLGPAELEWIAVSLSTRLAVGLHREANFYEKRVSLNTRIALTSVRCSHREARW